MVQLVKNLPAVLCRQGSYRVPPCLQGDLGSIPGLGQSPGEGERLPTPVFWPGEFHGLYSLWGRQKVGHN